MKFNFNEYDAGVMIFAFVALFLSVFGPLTTAFFAGYLVTYPIFVLIFSNIWPWKKDSNDE